MQVPYFRPAPIDYERIVPRIKDVINSQVYTKGCYRDELEDSLAEYLHVDNVVVTSSGTSALYIAMRVMRERSRSRRIAIPAFTWSSVPESVRMAGYRIAWNDIDKDTWLPKPIAINNDDVLGHDTFGSVDTNDYPEGRTVYDATHSVGIKGIWDRGIACCGSMAATKMISAGEGGFITTNDRNVAQRCTELRDLCSRIPEMSCVVAIEYLSHLDEMLDEKKKIAEYYHKHLPYQFQKIPHDSTHSKICFLCDESEELIARAAANSIECRRYYKPLHDMPHSTDVYNRIVCLPSWCGVDVKRVVAAIETIS